MKTTIISDALYLLLEVFNLYLSKIDAETAEISPIEDCDFSTWASRILLWIIK